MPKFGLPSNLPSWFPGHMALALRKMDSRANLIDLFLEVRDARLPLSSVNPRLAVYGKPPARASRLVVYAKRDLGDARFEQSIIHAFYNLNGETVLFADTANPIDVRRVHREIMRLAAANAQHRSIGDGPLEYQVMISGMPNVGKSSLLNALRHVGMNKGKTARTGSQAGVTRKLTGVVRIASDPDCLIWDTPGIMLPFLGKGDRDSERALNLALSGSIKEGLFPIETLAEYLLWRIVQRFYSSPNTAVPEAIQQLSPPLPTTHLPTFIEYLGHSIGALLPGGIVDEQRTMRYFVQMFRDGRLGSWALDDLTFAGAAYDRLPDGSNLFQQRRLTPPGESPLSVTAHSPLSSTGLTVSDAMPLQARVSLAVTTYVQLETQRFLHPTVSAMSKNKVRTTAKLDRLAQKRQTYSRQRVTRRPEHLYSHRDRQVRLRKRNRRK